MTVEIAVDATDLERVARFWEAALGYRRLYVRLPYVVSGPPEGVAGPRLVVQQVPEPPAGKSRVHLDLRVADPQAEVRRLVGLGATVEREVAEAGTGWVVMRDPEGTHFCVCPPRSG
jgi:predicted enzyme related to lactoylglutathione lyase